MTIIHHPRAGTIVVCDFVGLKAPEMIKRRPVVVVSPRFRDRGELCTIVPLSTTKPPKTCPYHHILNFDPPLPSPYDSPSMWVKADMVYTVAFHRLSLLFSGKDPIGNRLYDVRHVSADDLANIRRCVLHGLGLSALTGHI